MKLKLKLDKKTLQEFFIEQSEKVAFGAVVFLVLLVVYFALAHAERYGRAPAQLIKAALEGEKQMEQSRPEPGMTVADYVSKARRSRVHIEEKPYVFAAVIDNPLFPPRLLRDMPPVYAVQQLRGAAERGAFRIATREAAARDEPARPPRRDRRPTVIAAANRSAEDIRGQRWVSLVALVPVEKQLTAFKEALSGTVFSDPQRDVPEYLGFWVERVEVASPGEAADPDWKQAAKFTLKDAVRNAEKEWSPTQTYTPRGSDVVAEKYLVEPLVFPLGPLIDRPWGPSAAHEPKIPMMKPDVSRADGGMEGGGIRDPRRRLPGPGAEGEAALPPDSPFGDPEPKPDRPNKTPAPEDVRPAEDDKAPEYKLCRFFDFTVEPGKHYVYRVRLALQNPNRGLKPTYLKKPELAEVKFLETNWSEPSPVILVPRDVRILAVAVKPPLRQGGEPLGRVLVTKWVHRKGIEAFKEFSVVRGQVANFLDETFKPPRTAIHAGRAAIGGDVTAGPTAPFKLHYVTDATTIDLRGGGRLPGKRGSDPMFEPGEILLLDSDGMLAVRNEMEDSPVVEDLTSAGQEPEQPEGMKLDGLSSGPPPTGALEMLDGTPKKKLPKKKD